MASKRQAKTETEEQIRKRRMYNAQRMRERRNQESEDEARRRREDNALRMRKIRSQESEEKAKQRREDNARRMRKYRRLKSEQKLELKLSQKNSWKSEVNDHSMDSDRSGELQIDEK